MSDSLLMMINSLSEMERVIDETQDEITLEMCDQHFAQIGSVSEKTDRLISYMDSLKLIAAQLSEKSEAFKNSAKAAEKRLASLEQYAIYCLDKYPSLTGSDFELSKRLNPPSMKCDITKSFSKSNYLPDHVALDVPDEYRDLIPVWVLKADKVKADLKSGKELSFARLEQSTKLVTKVKMKELK